MGGAGGGRRRTYEQDSSIKRRKDVLSFAREHAWQPRGGSNVHTFIPVLLERLEAENAQLRGSVVELVLQIKALREALGRPQSET
jgi:hypothetical protein